ncbi:TorF family putative porin [Acinetobacter pseudolwoffii]|uniref:Porin n=1 Tax=Acinetobacter pseudolwoffii TaxID=2053287 RepID=A0A2H9YRE7_9GAMM|nr:TorF family putative porin [Acinetobacter pseudolwoffii]PJO75222.1 hypothetical protein CWI32_10285 [Acinetobacter pseudolwoffii]
MKLILKALSVAVLGAASTFTFADEPASEHTFSGNIGVLSSYNLRGITNVPENKGATLQGGLDYNHASGFYAGWWGSTLDYGSDNGSEFENNFYAGYNGSINEDLAYTIGLTYYYYYDVGNTDSNGFETMLGLSYKDFGISAQTLLEDTAWGNTGDTYLKGSYSYALPHDFSLDTALGLYIYKESGDYIPDSTESFGFRHFDIGLSKPLADTGVTASMNYILGGYDRNDVKQNNKVVFGLAYSF